MGQEHPGNVGLSENIKTFTCKSKYVLWVIDELPALFTRSCFRLEENGEHHNHLAKHHIFIIATEGLEAHTKTNKPEADIGFKVLLKSLDTALKTGT